MNVDPPGPHSLPCYDEAEAVNDGDLSPMPEVHDPEENNSCFQVSVAEKLQEEIGKFNPPGTELMRGREGRNGVKGYHLFTNCSP